MVQTIIFLPSFKACDSWRALAAMVVGDGGDHAGRPLKVEYRVTQLGVQHITVGNDQYAVEDSLALLASCRSARKWAVQAIEFVLPEPAEC
jgi:hypothetical protein